jgi:hypothetical protein
VNGMRYRARLITLAEYLIDQSDLAQFAGTGGETTIDALLHERAVPGRKEAGKIADAHKILKIAAPQDVDRIQSLLRHDGLRGQ